ncbi:helix-turn-helix domain-containing protein [Streptomyces sp. A3M-1-3]|uniref:helix-turn-helix domain-containing protein n=1 Tax=Streptomyces sp. A3M-1-3 TaxID=2962044 RepID=UPI00265F4504|nr:helix-turn-helix domain-containing protein [Streptomyces sp. A3M-1-3]
MANLAAVGRPGVHPRPGRERPGRDAGARGVVRTTRLKELLRQRREDLGLSQEDIAARLGISVRAYGNRERGLVKAWTDRKLLALAEALEMSEQQRFWLFRLTVDREPPQAWEPLAPAAMVADAETRAYLRDYATMMDAVAFPAVLFDHRWDVALTNPAFDALFRDVRPHPTAMPRHNLLRFVLFHPDAHTVLADHETSWCLPLLAQFAGALEAHSDDPGLLAVREEIARDPIMDTALRHGVPYWIRSVGPDVVYRDGAERPLRHPDPRWGRTMCRLVYETPWALEAIGFTRMTLVPAEPRFDPPRLRALPSHSR